jgi:hypothetical protein
VRERKVVEMDAAIAELREKVAAAEKAYAAVKKRQGKTKPSAGKNRAPRFFLIGASLSTRSMVAKVLGLKGCVTVPGERRTRPSPRLRGMIDLPLGGFHLAHLSDLDDCLTPRSRRQADVRTRRRCPASADVSPRFPW